MVQTPMRVVLVYETSANAAFSQVFLDGHPLDLDLDLDLDPQPSWLGYSIGR